MYGFYKLMPVWVQNLICSTYGYIERNKRFSREFKSFSGLFSQSDYSNKETLESMQLTRLADILNHSRKSVPFYQERINEEVTPYNARKVLSSLPYQTKELVNKGGAAFRSQDKCKAFHFKTSGTSGQGLSFIKCQSAISSQWAIWFRHRKRFQVSEGDLHVNFMGKPVVPNGKFPFWRFNKAFNQYLIPMQVVSEKNIKDIVSLLNTISPVFYSGYPSIISEVARIATSLGYSLNESSKPAYVFTGAEPLLETQKSIIEAWTGACVTQQYGMTEGVCNISECELGNYHEDSEFGYIEKLNPEIMQDGAIRAEIVGTSFFNFAQPFIRYRTGDTAIWESEHFSCACGRKTPVIRSIEGRLEDYVLLADGSRIMRFDYLFKNLVDVQEAQVVQREIGKIEIHYVAREKIDEAEVMEQVRKFVGSSLDVQFLKLHEIEREPNGKFRSVKSFIKS